MSNETPDPNIPDPKETGTPPPPREPVPKPEKQRAALPILLRQLAYITGLIFGSFKEVFLKFINIQDSTDVQKTIRSIHSGIELKGYNIWILIASAVLACIGLDQSSGAVIIGAMLISPLMSPILGIGLSIGMNDRTTLGRSAYNFGIAVVISLVTAVIYFWLTPLGRPTPELLARTQPTLLDVMVGFFGGVAGIVAGSRKEITNAIPGVAIATALMPPLCTAGFGLACGHFSYFLGAIYLFFLNVVFISLATFLIVRFLNFPLAREVTLSLRKSFLYGVVIFVILMITPASFLFINLIQTLREENDIQAFIIDKFPRDDFSVEGHEVIVKDSVEYLKITVAGARYLPQDSLDLWQAQLTPRYGMPEKRQLRVIQSAADPSNTEEVYAQVNAELNRQMEAYNLDREKWQNNQQELERLKNELELVQAGKLPVAEIRDEIQNYIPEVVELKLGEMRIANLSDPNTSRQVEKDENHLMIYFTWQDTLKPGVMSERKKLLEKRLKDKYNLPKVILVDENTPMIDYSMEGDDAVESNE